MDQLCTNKLILQSPVLLGSCYLERGKHGEGRRSMEIKVTGVPGGMYTLFSPK